MSRPSTAASGRVRQRLSTRISLAAALCVAGLILSVAGRAASPAAAVSSGPTVLHFQGNLSDTGGEPPSPCTGVGVADIVNCDGPFLRTSAELDATPAAQWVVANPALNGTNGRTIYDPSWVWNSGPTRLGGNMTIEWWASCGACGAGALSANWAIRLWVDGSTTPAFEQTVSATPALPNVPEKLSATLFLPEINASSNVVLHIDPVFIDTQNATRIFYDSQLPCPGSTGSEACDSKVTMPVLAPGEPAPTPTPDPTPEGGGAASSADSARFHTFLSPAGVGDSFGEPSIGANWKTGNIMFYGGFAADALRVRFDDSASPAKVTWTKTPLNLAATTRVLGDPILWTDRDTGRTLVSQLLGGTKQSTTDYTEDDGATYKPTVGAGINSGVDHQTLGGGPFAPGAPPHTYPNAVYYCAQDVADANCALSLDGGVTFGPAIPMYTLLQCGGLHGHIKVAPDGTAYVPNKNCGGQQGMAVSTDNGLTWTVKQVPGTSGSGEDPSIGIATDGTVYFGYVDGNGHPKAAVSRNRGDSWTDLTDLGAAFQLKHAVFPVTVAGDRDRAAVGFIGTPAAGDPNDKAGFRGVWHLYVATTYDGGKTWTTVNATPDDPVQIGSICRAGTTCGDDRNLLDFNDATVDKEGRVLIGYADGCVAPTCTTETAQLAPPYTASRDSKAVITRQSGGKRMFAAYDPAAGPTAPAAPRVDEVALALNSVQLKWSAPDDGGSPVTGYRVYRRAQNGTYGAALASAPASARGYTDTSAASGTNYFYKVTAVNAVGESAASGEFSPVVVETVNVCDLPGAAVVDDTAANADGGQNTPPDPRVDVKKVFVAEPYFDDDSKKIVFTLQTAPSANTTAPPSSEWFIIWNRRALAADGSDRMYVAMRTDASGATSFDYGNFGPALPLDGSIPPANANTPTRLGAADTGSYDPLTGVIRITLASAKAENSQPGQVLAGVNARTFFSRAAVGPRSQNVSSDITGEGAYQVRGNLACRPNTPPVAILAASKLAGAAPLAIEFDASGTTDADGDQIVEYTFSFGDGTEPVTQSSPRASHIFASPGDYFVRLTAKDARGAASSNNAQLVITAIDGIINHALASNGGKARVSSVAATGSYGPAGAIDGDLRGINWGKDGGWKDGTANLYPDWIEIIFSGVKPVTQVRVTSLQDDPKNPVEPTAQLTANVNGLLDYTVEYWTGSQWVALGSVTGNNFVLSTVSFAEVRTSKIRVLVTRSRANYSRVIEVEAFGPAQ